MQNSYIRVSFLIIGRYFTLAQGHDAAAATCGITQSSKTSATAAGFANSR